MFVTGKLFMLMSKNINNGFPMNPPIPIYLLQDFDGIMRDIDVFKKLI